MCSFIILLLLLGKNCGSCCSCANTCTNVRNRGCVNNYGKSRDNDCDDYDDHDHHDYHDCHDCHDCHDYHDHDHHADTSPIVEREDIWTSYKNPSTGKQCK